MPNSTWKHTERRIARTFGGHRLGPTGSDTPDVLTPWLSIEVKHRRKLPAWIVVALDKARRGAAPAQLGIAVLHEAGRRGEGDLVVMSAGDVREWFGDERPQS
jgi:hypothetical protein